jgi:hypothetical protein
MSGGEYIAIQAASAVLAALNVFLGAAIVFALYIITQSRNSNGN